MSAKDEVLARVRAALRDVPEGERPEDVAVERGYHRTGPAGLDRLVERLEDYRAIVRRAGSQDVAAVVAEALAAHGARRVAVAPGLDPPWRPEGGVELVEDDGTLAPRELERLDGALTGCALAVAETGTIVLDGGARSGRRALTLLPDLHVCVVEASQVVGSVPEAIAALEEGVRAARRPITFVSGPSATSDIELNRVEGVHGPRLLEVVVVG